MTTNIERAEIVLLHEQVVETQRRLVELSTALRQRVITAVQAGESQAALARVMGLSRARVHQLVSEGRAS